MTTLYKQMPPTDAQRERRDDSLPMLRPISFASCYVYSPAGSGAICARSRLLRSLLKAADQRFMARSARTVQQQAAHAPQLAEFFPADILLPVPGSAPRREAEHWPAAALAAALVHEGLGLRVWSGLHRISAVRKSATALAGTRPSVASHYRSFGIEPSPFAAASVLLIDDVVTRGRTLLAAAARAREAFPRAQLRAFALLRTDGFASGVPRLLDPCSGEIRWQFGEAQRSP